MTPRLRRLQADFQNVTAIFTNHPHIRVVEMEGSPPEKYLCEFTVEGLVPQAEESFRARIGPSGGNFPAARLSAPPAVLPDDHPGVSSQHRSAKICIGDHWSAGQSLAQLILRIAEMICYQSYNVKSPLNAGAAAWAEQNVDKLPLMKADLSAGV
jgi:hypothetical protein